MEYIKMAKATLTFDLNDPDDQCKYRCASKATDMWLVLWDLDQWLRRQHKYDAGEIDLEEAGWSVRQKLHQILDDYGVNLDELSY